MWLSLDFFLLERHPPRCCRQCPAMVHTTPLDGVCAAPQPAIIAIMVTSCRRTSQPPLRCWDEKTPLPVLAALGSQIAFGASAVAEPTDRVCLFFSKGYLSPPTTSEITDGLLLSFWDDWCRSGPAMVASQFLPDRRGEETWVPDLLRHTTLSYKTFALIPSFVGVWFDHDNIG